MNFTNSGMEMEYNVFDFTTLNPEFNVGLFMHIKQIDSVYIIGSFFGNQQWSNSAPPGEIIFDTTNITANFNVFNYKHYLNNDSPYSIAVKSNKKLLSNSVFSQPTDWDISLSKLNQNLEYDTLDPGIYTYDSLCATPGLPQSGFISLDDCNLFVDIDEIPTAKQYQEIIRWIPIHAYPNPVTHGKLTLEFENSDHHSNMELRCYDDFGRQIHSQLIYKGQQDTEVNVSGWSPGIYIAVVFSNGEARGQSEVCGGVRD